MYVRISATIIGVGLLMSPLWATTVLEQSFPSLVQEADTIVSGTVTAVEAAYDFQRAAPFTFITLRSLTVLKGDPTLTKLTLEFYGGPTPDGNHISIAGLPTLAVGDRIVAFVVGNRQSLAPLVGLWQGIFRVRFDPEIGADVMTTAEGQPLTALPMPSAPGRLLHPGEGQAATEAGVPAILLDTFLDSIIEEVQHGLAP